MHEEKDAQKKERGNPLIFIPIMLFGTYLIYLAVSLSFRYGEEVGLKRAPYKQPDDTEEEEQVFNHRQLMEPSEELISMGSNVYTANCAACHGSEGKGDGPSGQMLSVQPREFQAPPSEWKNGADTLTMYDTLENGLGQMPNFPALNPEQKYAVIHYIHSEFMDGEYPAASEEAIASLPEPSAGGGGANINPYAQQRVPIRYAIMKMVEQGEGQNASSSQEAD